MNIRQEAEGDFDNIYALIKEAFKTAAVYDGDEHDYYAKVRRSANYIPELSLVAVLDGNIVGHAMLSRTVVHDGQINHDFLVLAILSVAEGNRREGVGSALVYVLLDRARQLGHSAVFIAGDRNYYGRFGFAPALRFGIRYKGDVPPEMLDNIMALELIPNALDDIKGIVNL
jgi:putative acetyltransferase